MFTIVGVTSLTRTRECDTRSTYNLLKMYGIIRC